MVNPRVKEQAEKDRQERLAYVGALAAGLVHEVRNPLHVIQLNVQMLAEDVDKLPTELRSRYERRSKRIYQEVQALSKTLEMFLTFARPPRLATEPIDLNHFLRELLEFVQPEFTDSGVALEYRLASDMYPVLIDQNQFSHVILNLLRNAREAIEQRREKDCVDVEGRVAVRTFEDDKIIRIEIEDNGIGVTPGDEEKIFEVFYTTKEKGTGLGLGIVRRIVEEHRGEIVAEPGRAEGACFVVRLPRGHLLEFKAE
ncbi:MAG: GHKL domain-containing protein [Planctomycetes bacterium]|nr:GHKL domain-containing protein [Planctomycetota bacterium]